ncbi:MAG: c-type cytochrome [Anaerolineales bacterium]|nr:c-type cytochrome [Anaerolineales bacterium]
MFSKTKLAIGFALLLALIFTIPVFAGGWAVITLDELPTDVVVGEEFTVGFMVLQHGKTPMTDLSPIIIANLNKDSHFKVIAKEEGKPGHYTATLTFPKEGEWNWTIEAFSMQQKMPTLIVSAPSVAVVSEPVTESITQISTSPNFVIAIAAFVIGLVSLFFAVQRKSKLAASITALCLMIGLALTIAGTSVPAVEAQSESSSSEVIESSVSQVEYGRDLFIAKGCITCHYNSKAASHSEYWTIEPTGATNLSNFSADPLILEMRLKDPTSVNSNSQMPQLDLTSDEIQALIAFINSK